jgi:hypothetical protein
MIACEQEIRETQTLKIMYLKNIFKISFNFLLKNFFFFCLKINEHIVNILFRLKSQFLFRVEPPLGQFLRWVNEVFVIITRAGKATNI